MSFLRQGNLRLRPMVIRIRFTNFKNLKSKSYIVNRTSYILYLLMRLTFTLLAIVLFHSAIYSQSKALVFQTDFGLKDGAVAAMKGVAYSVDKDLAVFDLTHEIPAYNIWEAAYRLKQTAPYWP